MGNSNNMGIAGILLCYFPGIEQSWVDKAPTFPEVLAQFMTWFEQELLSLTNQSPTSKSFLFITCGDWDLGKMMKTQCNASQLPVPPIFQAWANLKTIFMTHTNQKPKGMTDMLSKFNLPLVGREHRGIDDARNIAEVAKALVRQDVVLNFTTSMPKGYQYFRNALI